MTEVMDWLATEIAFWEARHPLSFEQWLQLHRLLRAQRALKAYAQDEQPGDDYDTEGDPR